MNAQGSRGEGAAGYLAVILLFSAVLGGISVSPVGDDVGDGIESAICRVLRAGDLAAADECDPPPTAQPPANPVIPKDPNEPSGPCLAYIHSEYLENTLAGRFRYFDVMTDGGSQLTMRRYVQGGGKPDIWEVWDGAWMNADIGTPTLKSKIPAGFWIGPMAGNTEIYRFDNEKDARDFYNRMREYRIGNWAKNAFRTNPLTGWIPWAGGHLPWVGDDIEEWVGNKEPDLPPAQEFYEAGIWNGFWNDVPVGPLSIVGKNFGWTTGGSWKDNQTGQTTYFFSASQQLMESVTLDSKPARSYASRKWGKNWSPEAAQEAIKKIEKELTTKGGTPVTLPPAVRRAIELDGEVGVGLRGTYGRWYGLVVDKDGKAVGLTQIDQVQGSWHLRAGANIGPGSAWIQDSQWAAKWRTNKNLDLNNPQDRVAYDAFVRQLSNGPAGPVAGALVLDEYFNNGGGTMSKVTYDSDVRTTHPNVDFGVGFFEYENETVTDNGVKGEYFDPDKGWVKWERCGLN
ncbi:hypothetical protein DPM19_28765 [Actinomadura craniellae]|uniref:Uncharacterized protein n=2 Tax=Actinomadura craniellae TaxID=2231787 RepID=A0A365GXQ6_9ACTN|nr:hypothetical protein DPM19_28765 [Actinomadura craniellae]